MKTYIRLAVVGIFAIAAMSMTACNTIEGVGEDAQSAGKKVEEVANDAKN